MPGYNCTCDGELIGSGNGENGCSCLEGFNQTEAYDGSITCVDIDECAEDPCHTNANCSNNRGSYSCQCKIGFRGDGAQCKDVDECDGNPCHVDAECNNTIGSYFCKCKPGFEGNGRGEQGCQGKYLF